MEVPLLEPIDVLLGLRDRVSRMFVDGGPLEVIQIESPEGFPSLRQHVLEGLGRPEGRELSPIYFYDATGSELYEVITGLDEYYPTRHEAALLQRIAPDLERLEGVRQLVELGSGSSTKTRIVLEALGAGRTDLTYVPIDVSREMLAESARMLVADHPGWRVIGLAGRYEPCLDALAPSAGRMFMFLGGTIGNFTPEVQEGFFAHLAGAMAPGNLFLLGFDRRPHAGKARETIQLAYDDPHGVTAAFNLNLLSRLNRELGTDFDPGSWQHLARYDDHLDRIEMHLVCRRDQEVRVPGERAPLTFRRGETILTEISRKFDPDDLAAWFGERGFRTVANWADEPGYVGLLLLERSTQRNDAAM